MSRNLQEASLSGQSPTVASRLANLEDHQYEERAVNQVLAQAARLGMNNAAITFAKTSQAFPRFHSAMFMAVLTDLISQEDYENLTGVSLIIHDWKQRRHAVVEITLRTCPGKIFHALERSKTLQAATSEQATLAIATPGLAPEFIKEAAEFHAQVFTVPA